jgi:glutamate dehydrogenase/leucine dehydrogenase
MAWMFDTYSMNKGHSVLGVVTGKPLTIGGSLGRDSAPARGALFTLEAALGKQGKTMDGLRVAVQGFGKVGSQFSAFAAERGAKVVGISDSSGGVHADGGIDVAAALAHKRDGGSLADFPGGEQITNDELIALPCDVFAPCALEQVVTEANADSVKAGIVVEGANGPLTPGADDILEERGALILPDVLANAGGVVVSYFEWVQGLQEYFWKEDEVNAQLNEIITRAFEETWATRSDRSTSMRLAAYGVAVQRVAEATVTRGLYP